MANAKKDDNRIATLIGTSSSDGATPINVYVDPTTHRLLVDNATTSGTVTSVSVVTANGISGSVATATTTPAITLTLGVITPTSVNGLTLASQAIGFTIAGGTTSKTLTVPLDASVSGTNTGDNAANSSTVYIGTTAVALNRTSAALVLTGITSIDGNAATVTGLAVTAGQTLTVTTGGTIGSAAYTAATAYAAALSGTQNEIAYFNTTTTIASLAVATYPSLTELSYVKGLSSAVQTQINNRLQLAGGTMTGDLTIGDAKQVVLTAPTADVTCTGFSTSAFNAGYTSTAVGDLVYLDSSATWQKVDADAIATAGGMLGIALEVKASGNACKVALPGSFVRVNAWNWTTIGQTLYASETPGGIATAIPTGADGVVREIGWACNADYIYFMPNSGNSTVVA